MSKSWYVGRNEPGALPVEEPKKFTSWVEARSHLRSTMGEHFASGVTETSNRDHMFAYTRASATMRMMREGEPYSLFYGGLVWWLADL